MVSLVTNLIILGGAALAFLAAGGPQRVSGFISEQTSSIRSAVSRDSETPREIREAAQVQGPRQNIPSRSNERQQSTPNVTINLTGNAQDIANQPREQRRENQRRIEQSVPQNIRANTHAGIKRLDRSCASRKSRKRVCSCSQRGKRVG